MSNTKEPVAWMYPCDLENFKTNEAVADAFSIQVGSNTKGEAVPLYSAEQLAQLEREKAELLEALKEIKAECEDAPSLGYHGYVIGRSSRALAISGGKV